MRAGYMPAVGAAEFRDDMPEPQIGKADDVKIKIHNCGICGSEVHAYHGLHPFRIPAHRSPAMSCPARWSRSAAELPNSASATA